MIDLSNKVSIITGGSRGIGEACVRLFANANSKVAFTYKSAKQHAEKLEKEFPGKVKAYKVDMDELLKTAKRTKTVMEIDAFPDRLDLKDEYIRKAVETGVKLAIDSDAHSASHFQYLEYGIAQARRGWAEKKDIINTKDLEDMLKLLK